MNKREALIARIEYAGYHNDTATGIRLYAENRVSFAVYAAAFRKGAEKRTRGVRCNCDLCRSNQ